MNMHMFAEAAMAFKRRPYGSGCIPFAEWSTAKSINVCCVCENIVFDVSSVHHFPLRRNEIKRNTHQVYYAERSATQKTPHKRDSYRFFII